MTVDTPWEGRMVRGIGKGDWKGGGGKDRGQRADRFCLEGGIFFVVFVFFRTYFECSLKRKERKKKERKKKTKRRSGENYTTITHNPTKTQPKGFPKKIKNIKKHIRFILNRRIGFFSSENKILRPPHQKTS